MGQYLRVWLLSGPPHDSDPTPPSHSPLHAGTSRVGKLSKGLRFKGRAGCRAGRRGEGEACQYLCSPPISGFPSPLLPQPQAGGQL